MGRKHAPRLSGSWASATRVNRPARAEQRGVGVGGPEPLTEVAPSLRCASRAAENLLRILQLEIGYQGGIGVPAVDDGPHLSDGKSVLRRDRILNLPSPNIRRVGEERRVDHVTTPIFVPRRDLRIATIATACSLRLVRGKLLDSSLEYAA